MSTQKGHPNMAFRLRITRISEKLINAFTVSVRGTSPSPTSSLFVSRFVVLLFLASIGIICIGSLRSAIFSRQERLLSHSSGESEPFRGKSAATEKKDAESSLVTPKIDDEVTTSSNFDAAEEPVARMIVITMDRENSLRRLLRSLEHANYGEDHVDLDIWIDRPKEGNIHQGVLQASRDIDWKHGTKVIHKRAVNAGLYQQWIYTWNITEETTEFAVILEDDLELSPAFYQWLRVARAAYAQDADVGAFSLQRHTLRPKQIRGVASGNLNIAPEHQVYKYRLLGTWGFAPQRDQWVEFRTWFEEKRARGEKPYVKGLITTDWYKRQEVRGFAPNMWSQWWIKFADEKGYFTVTANLPGETTLCANWREDGLHYSKKKPQMDFPIFRGNEEQFVMPDEPISVDWDGRTISQNDSSNKT